MHSMAHTTNLVFIILNLFKEALMSRAYCNHFSPRSSSPTVTYDRGDPSSAALTRVGFGIT
jgi:hypothetical protein